MKSKKREFSKLIIIQESILVWITTIVLLIFAYLSIINNYIGSLPYLTTLVSVVWAAYGTSVAFYYNKAKAENLCKFEKMDDVVYEDMSGLKGE